MNTHKDKGEVKYNENRGCPKCGSGSTNDKYDNCGGEINRTCNNCGFDWYESPLDR